MVEWNGVEVIGGVRTGQGLVGRLPSHARDADLLLVFQSDVGRRSSMIVEHLNERRAGGKIEDLRSVLTKSEQTKILGWKMNIDPCWYLFWVWMLWLISSGVGIVNGVRGLVVS